MAHFFWFSGRLNVWTYLLYTTFFFTKLKSPPVRLLSSSLPLGPPECPDLFLGSFFWLIIFLSPIFSESPGIPRGGGLPPTHLGWVPSVTPPPIFKKESPVLQGSFPPWDRIGDLNPRYFVFHAFACFLLWHLAFGVSVFNSQTWTNFFHLRELVVKLQDLRPPLFEPDVFFYATLFYILVLTVIQIQIQI